DAVRVVARAGPDGLPLLTVRNHAGNCGYLVFSVCRRACCRITSARTAASRVATATRIRATGTLPTRSCRSSSSTAAAAATRCRRILALGHDPFLVFRILGRLDAGSALRRRSRSLSPNDNRSEAPECSKQYSFRFHKHAP